MCFRPFLSFSDGTFNVMSAGFRDKRVCRLWWGGLPRCWFLVSVQCCVIMGLLH